jgi:hypothetical protein
MDGDFDFENSPNTEREDRELAYRFVRLWLKPNLTRYERTWMSQRKDEVFRMYVRGRLSSLRHEAVAWVSHKERMGEFENIKETWEEDEL